ncbi:MAG: Cell death protease [Chrysothrix sp. TS-e1954]|nr:MAG: Cell death protease [Chrysothrix sp. TS-e1954]
MAASGKTAADYFVSSLPGAPEGDPLLKMHAGHIEVSPETHGNLFFWHYQNRHIGDKQRTVIWLNGGPGCSSEDGALMEVGPYRVREGGNLEYNNGSWDEFANLLFVDQPVGTGFSYVDTNAYIHELDEMADHFVAFLERWFEVFPDYAHDDLYLAGESYAGQHIPYISRAILERNKKKTLSAPWHLAGMLIGNGWIDPVAQYPSYLQFSYAENLIIPGSSIASTVEASQKACMEVLNAGAKDHVDSGSCEKVLQTILDQTKNRQAPEMQQCVNMYDVRLRDDSSCGMNWPPDLKDITPYLRREDVKAALHVDANKRAGWTECAGAVSSSFSTPKSVPAVKLLPDILAAGVPILLFSGGQDLICNHIGTENLIRRLSWLDGKGFELSPGITAPKRAWTFEGEEAGIWQEARNLTYVLFYNASHMVPFDYPRRTRDMLDRFMGVDIASVGGTPADSRIDGEKGLETSVGGHPNSTAAQEEQSKQLKGAEWKGYWRGGELALVIVIIMALGYGYYVWLGRRRRRLAGYTGVAGDDDPANGGMGLMESVRDAVRQAPPMRLERFRNSSHPGADLEAADFDEAELDDLTPRRKGEEGKYSLGSDDESDTEGYHDAKGHGHTA